MALLTNALQIRMNFLILVEFQ